MLVIVFCFIFKSADYKDLLKSGWINPSFLLKPRKESGFRYHHSSQMPQTEPFSAYVVALYNQEILGLRNKSK